MLFSRFFLLFVSLFLFLLSPFSSCQHLPLPPLRFGYNSLEPFISERLLRFHHLKHHKTYTDGTNTALNTLRINPATNSLAKSGIDTILSKLDEISDIGVRNSLKNQGGGYVNHHLFFKTLQAPQKVPLDQAVTQHTDMPVPDGVSGIILDDYITPQPTNKEFIEELDEEFGSFQQFQAKFNSIAGQVFGSGWTFLYLNATDFKSVKLQIALYSNQETPLNHPNCYPILALDEWEHAYYLDYYNKRADWIQYWWKLIDWKEVEKLFLYYRQKILKIKNNQNQVEL
jgi:Fe-Mn family superoxide dismutase